MKANKKHISKDNFQRYLENQMTDTERNAFERELQKHPFEAEALEGFRQVPSSDLEEDLNELSARLSSKKKNRTRIWAVAATFLLLISTGIALFQLTHRMPSPELTESKISPVLEAETTPSESQNNELIVSNTELKKQTIGTIKERGAKTHTNEPVTPTTISEAMTDEELPMEIPDSVEIKPVEFAKLEELTAEETALTRSKLTTDPSPEIRIRGISMQHAKQKSGAELGFSTVQSAIGDQKIVLGKIISLEDSLPLPGVTIVEKGTSNGTVSDAEGKFFLKLTSGKDSALIASFVGMESKAFFPIADSSLIIGLEPSALALNEVVAVGYGVMRKSQMSDNIKNAQPQYGMNAFRKYIAEHAVLPEDYPKKKVMVNVAFQIDVQGKIGSVENVNLSEIAVFEKAKLLLLNGPAWNPKVINGNPVESKVNLWIVFKKEK